MGDLRISGGNNVNFQILSAMKKSSEGSATEETQESQAEKLTESQKNVAAKALSPSPAGVGNTIDIVV